MKTYMAWAQITPEDKVWISFHELESTGNLKEVEQELAPYGFLRCKSCSLVNCSAITGVTNEYICIGEHRLYISRKRKKEVLKFIADFYAGGGKI